VVYCALTVNGELNGSYEEWDTSGTLVADKTYSDGVEVGADGSDVGPCIDEWDDAYRTAPSRPAFPPAELERQWNASCRAGKRPSASDSGLPSRTISSGQAASNGCIDAWTAKYRRENGDNVIVTADQLGEWQSWCKEGKRPE
jgi:hypothetical protein